ncbi:glycosyltransferase [Ulvibacterium sp.]|uniref:glycosyltransferase n=1 Tax=Ulvibacterium sp. TaxID=2665914 RepID=UPI002613010D|nr:glycosyltransferase [Ulvibacterium sp.]
MIPENKDVALFHIVNHMHHGGCQKIVYEILKGIDIKDLRKVLIARPGHYSNLLSNEKDISFINRKNFGFFGVIKLLFQARKTSKKIILHTHARKDIVFGFFLRKMDTHIHTYHSTYLKKNKLMGYLKADISISISETVKRYLDKFNISSQIIFNGIDKPIQSYSKNQDNIKCPKLVYIGRLSSEKGIYELINDLFAIDGLHLNKLYLDVIGGGDLMDKCIERVSKTTSYSCEISFFGFQNKPWEKLSQYDILVIPSMYEGFCLVGVEASIRGIPIIANDIPALREILYFLPEQCFFHTGDPESLNRALNYTVNNWHALVKLCKKKRKEFELRFGLESMIKKHEQIYDAVI